METIRKPGRFIEVTRKALALRKPLVMLKVGTGEISAEGGMTAGVAKLILDKRRAIERIFAEWVLTLIGATVDPPVQPWGWAAAIRRLHQT